MKISTSCAQQQCVIGAAQQGGKDPICPLPDGRMDECVNIYKTIKNRLSVASQDVAARRGRQGIYPGDALQSIPAISCGRKPPRRRNTKWTVRKISSTVSSNCSSATTCASATSSIMPPSSVSPRVIFHKWYIGERSFRQRTYRRHGDSRGETFDHEPPAHHSANQ